MGAQKTRLLVGMWTASQLIKFQVEIRSLMRTELENMLIAAWARFGCILPHSETCGKINLYIMD
jgi:hypothetical protein